MQSRSLDRQLTKRIFTTDYISAISMEGKDTNTSRRDFLKKMGIIGAGAVAGGAALYSGFKFEKSKPESGKKVRLLNEQRQLVEVDSAHLKISDGEQGDKGYLLKHGRKGIPGKKWVMVIDLAKCRNAQKCMRACQGAHQLRPETHHLNVLSMQDSPQTAPYFMPKPCQHCDNPPCVPVCPVDATFKRDDGIVLIDNERCIGCRFCIAGCPYSSRSFNWLEPINPEKYAGVEYDMELNVPQKKGTVTKCVFSADHLRVGELPYCTSACPNGVYWFGDQNEDAVTNGTTKETARLSDLLRDNAAYTLMEELGTKPSVFYLPAKNRQFPYPEDEKQHPKES
jgi:molybdopterin-containing oxidoreductase family iron-sulfur binding subunit